MATYTPSGTTNPYARLSEDLSTVLEIDQIDPNLYAYWQAISSPKSTRYLPYIVTAQPTFNASTQSVSQNGYTINAGVSVNPVWQILSLSSDQQTAIASQASWQATTALNIVTLGKTAIGNWVPGPTYSGTKDTVLLDLLKVVVAMLESQYGIHN